MPCQPCGCEVLLQSALLAIWPCRLAAPTQAAPRAAALAELPEDCGKGCAAGAHSVMCPLPLPLGPLYHVSPLPLPVQPHGLSCQENVVKECGEEASIPAALASQAVPVGAVSYTSLQVKGLQSAATRWWEVAGTACRACGGVGWGSAVG